MVDPIFGYITEVNTIFLQTATHVVAETKQLRRFAKSFKNENKIVSHVQGVLRI